TQQRSCAHPVRPQPLRGTKCKRKVARLWYVFFHNVSAPAHLPTLSLHDALPIFHLVAADPRRRRGDHSAQGDDGHLGGAASDVEDRKSTRLNSSHRTISYAVFCLKKKKIHSSMVCRWSTILIV